MTEAVQAKISQIDQLKATGLSTKIAASKVGMSVGNYYARKSQLRKLARRPRGRPARLKVTEIQALPSNPNAFLFYGDPEQIAAIVRSLR